MDKKLVSANELPENARRMLEYWHFYNDSGNRPTRNDFSPFNLIEWLGYIDVYGVEQGGEEFRIRLEGTKIVLQTEESWINKTANDVDQKYDLGLHNDLFESFQNQRPSVHKIAIFQKNFIDVYRLILPIFSTDDGTVVQVFLALFRKEKEI